LKVGVNNSFSTENGSIVKWIFLIRSKPKSLALAAVFSISFKTACLTLNDEQASSAGKTRPATLFASSVGDEKKKGTT
jgi:hypothetical protein